MRGAKERPALSRGAVTGAVLLSGIALAAGANLPYAAMVAIGSSALAIAASALAVLLSSISGRRTARLLAPSAVLACFAAVPAGMMFAGGTTQAFVMLCAALLAASLLAAGFSLIPSGGAPARVMRQPGMAAATAAFAPPPCGAMTRRPRTPVTTRSGWRSPRLISAYSIGTSSPTRSRCRHRWKRCSTPAGRVGGTGRDWRARIHADDFETFRTALEEYRGTAEISFALDFRARGADGVVRWLQLQGSTLSNGGRAVRCIGLAGDITAQKDHEASLIAAVRHDGLTGLPNRIVLMEALAARLASANPVHKIALLVADLDRFKTFNDALGTQAGDVLLATAGERLRRAAPPHALAARLGADRFALLWSAGEEFEAAAEADAVLAALGEPLALGGQDIYPSASGGLALAEAPAAAGAHLAAAELALEAAKRGGGGQLSLFAHP